jgi:hypothetical protein
MLISVVSYLGIIVLNFVRNSPENRTYAVPARGSSLTTRFSRIANFKKDGLCVIGMEVKSLIPLIAFDAFLNVSTYQFPLTYYPERFPYASIVLIHLQLYLTLCFVLPLRRSFLSEILMYRKTLLTTVGLYSYHSNPSSPLRALALRSFIGSVGILASAMG